MPPSQQKARTRDDAGAPAEAPRVSFPVLDGKFALDRMQDSRKDELRKYIAATPGLLPAAAPASGGGDDDGDLATRALWARLSKSFYQVLGTFGAEAIKRSGAGDDAAAVMLFTDAEIAQLSDPTARVLAKYIPNVTTKYADELILAATLTSIVGDKMAKVKAARAAKPGPRAVSTFTPQTTPTEPPAGE